VLFFFDTNSEEDKFIWMFIESESSGLLMAIQHPYYKKFNPIAIKEKNV